MKALSLAAVMALSSAAWAGEWYNVDFSNLPTTAGNSGSYSGGGGWVSWNGDPGWGNEPASVAGVEPISAARQTATNVGPNGLLFQGSPVGHSDILFQFQFNRTAYPTDWIVKSASTTVGDPNYVADPETIAPGQAIQSVDYGAGEVFVVQYNHISDATDCWGMYPLQQVSVGDHPWDRPTTADPAYGTRIPLFNDYAKGNGIAGWGTDANLDMLNLYDHSKNDGLEQTFKAQLVVRPRGDGLAGTNAEYVGNLGAIDKNLDTALPTTPSYIQFKWWEGSATGEPRMWSDFTGATWDGTKWVGDYTKTQYGLLNMKVGKTKSTDANLDYVTDIDDALVLLGNFNKTSGMTMTDGDATNDGAVDVDDALELLGNFNVASDAAAAGTAHAHYDPATGHVYLDAKGVSGYSLKSASPGFLTGATPLWSTTGTSRTDTDLKIGEASFSGNLNDLTSYDLGAVAATNIAAGNLTFTYSVTGLGTFSSAVQYMAVPEPAALSLLAIGALGLLARRRRAA